MLASLIRVVRDITLAEDALQDAFHAALAQWPAQGAPPNPVAWLMLTARHKAIDQIRRRALAEEKVAEAMLLAVPDQSAPEPQDTLRLIFTCCHPALAREAQVALTLSTVCGLRTEEIARAFLVPLPTMAQRLVRAKGKIKLAGIPYTVPADDELQERLKPVLEVLYLVFNEGYAASAGSDMIRADLCAEAIRLCREITTLLPAEIETRALLALMLLHHARGATRTDAAGDLVLLENQDRSRWDHVQIEEGLTLTRLVLSAGAPGIYALQAGIAALHAQAPSAAETDWRQIAALYGLLKQKNPSPVIELNRAVAVALAEGYEKGLTLMEKIDLPGYHLLPAAKADLLRRLGRNHEAAQAYRKALELVKNDAERRFLQRRLVEVTSAG